MVQAKFLNGTKNRISVTCSSKRAKCIMASWCFSFEYLYLIATLDTARSPFRPSQATEKVCQPWKMSNS